MKCGLLGRKLGHSYSPQIHAALADYSYELFEKEPEELESFLKNGDFHAINVTIPYKKDVIPYLRSLSPAAQRMGAVNTIVRQKDGSLIGHNTDYFGFASMVHRSGLNVSQKKVLVLGSGGASNTAVVVLQEMGANVVVISRNGENNYQNISLHRDAAVIVNATPVGMFPNVGVSPVDLDLFNKLEGVLDVIYNPARTQLLMDAEARGLRTMNGLWMLVAQAKESAEWFADRKYDDSEIARIYRILKRQMENIVLIGMPGCGKSTIGTALAEALGRRFADADAELEAAAGRKITELIPQEGVEAFRALETETLKKLGMQSGLVLSTGGGCVTKERNYQPLHQNGTIIWIKRSLDSLPTEGRPLSRKEALASMYQEREPMYQRFADAVIENDSTVEAAVERILSLLEEHI